MEEAAAEVPPERDPFAALPAPLACKILALLPLDTRLRCAEVSPRWRAAVAERSLWTRLDFRGVARENANNALLRCAAARAGRSLQALDAFAARDVTHTAVHDVCAANAGAALTEVTLHAFMPTFDLQEVANTLLAAPQLRSLCVPNLEVPCPLDLGALIVALRNEAPFVALRVRELWFTPRNASADELCALAQAVATHASLTSLMLWEAPQLGRVPAALDAVVDAALARQLTRVEFIDCMLTPACVPALARLLSGTWLTRLQVCIFEDGSYTPLLDAPSATLLSDALRANATLTELVLHTVGLWLDPSAAVALLSALTAHPSIRELDISGTDFEQEERQPWDGESEGVASALGALVAADAPALTELRVHSARLGAAGLRPLLEALRRNSQLRVLDVAGNGVSESFAADVLLPAVRVNTSLRKLRADAWYAGDCGGAIQLRECTEAVALVAARAAADAAADAQQ
jgi:hypothetical protein